MEKHVLLKVKDVAEILNMAEISIYNMVYRREIPFVKIGRNLRFDRSKISAWIFENSHDKIKSESKP